jgi:hypothetical protein
MRVRLAGINSVHKRLADGTFKTFWYAWKSGPPLRGEPGSPEFIASYNAAAATKKVAPSDTMLSILQGYQASEAFRGCAERRRADYVKKIKIIEKKFADFPLAALTDRRSRGLFMAWRDELALRSRRQADYAWTVLARVLSWAEDRGLVAANPCARGADYIGDPGPTGYGRQTMRRTSWPRHRLTCTCLLCSRFGPDSVKAISFRLTWKAYDGKHIRLKQSKTGARVVIPVGAPLKAMLDCTARRSPMMLVNLDGQPWSPDGFRVSWRKACAKAGVVGVTYHDLRGTAVTRLAIAGSTDAEIATLTGHSLKDVHAILDAHYLNRDPALAESAVRKLESRTKTPN